MKLNDLIEVIFSSFVFGFLISKETILYINWLARNDEAKKVVVKFKKTGNIIYMYNVFNKLVTTVPIFFEIDNENLTQEENLYGFLLRVPTKYYDQKKDILISPSIFDDILECFV